MGATNIKQFKLICLLNVIYKIIMKVLMMRLTLVAHKVIGANQSSFLPGRHILDGVVVLHETLHELRRQKEGIVLKLDFEKSWLVGVSDGGP